MQVRLLILIIFISVASYGQEKVNEQFVNQPLSEVFHVLEEIYHLKLAYDPELIKGIEITIDIQDLDIEEALVAIFENTELSFDKVKSNYYTIRPSEVSWDLSGKIIEENKEGIPYVKIRFLGTYKGVYSDEQGNFKLNYKSDKPPMLEVSSLGFKTTLISAKDIKNGEPILLERDVKLMQEVMVEYLTEGISVMNDVSSITLRPKKIGAIPGTTEPDVFQMVQNIPGINSASSTVSEIQIRGGTADQNQLIWDGITIYHPGHFNGMISSINPNIIDKTELHRGVYDPFYGGKSSGLIKLNSINHIPEKFEVGGGVNMLQGDAYIVSPIGKKVAILVSGRRSYMDLWKSPTYLRYADRVYQETEILNEGVYSDDPDFAGAPVEEFSIENRFLYNDINGKIIYKPNKDNLLTISALHSKNNLEYSANLVGEQEFNFNEISTTNSGASVNFNHTWNSKWESALLGAFAQYRYNFRNEFSADAEGELIDESTDKSNAVDHYSFKWNNKVDLNENHSLSGGYQFYSNEVNYSIATNEEQDSVTEAGLNEGMTNALHLNYIFQNKRLLTKTGGRISSLETTGEIYLEPRIYTQYQISKWLTVKGAFGMQNQFISQVDEFEEAQLGLSNRIWVMADNGEIPVVKSTIYNAGLVARSKGWHFEIDGYYKEINDIVNFSDNPAFSSGLIRGDATTVGIDFLVKKRWKNYRSWISYSLANVQYKFNELSTNSFAAPFNQRHTLKWVNILSWRQFEFSSAFKIASGKPYTPIKDIVLVEDPDLEEELEGLYEIEYGVTNSKTLPLFHQLDLTLLYTFPKNPEKKWKGKVGISFFNVYNKSNVLSRQYELDINDEDLTNPIIETYAVDKYYLKFTPNALIRFEF